MTCVYCGADAVDASGVCQACGRHVASASATPHHDSHDAYESTDATAETREADILLPARRATAAPPLAHQGPPAMPAPRSGDRNGDRGDGGPRTGVRGGSGVYGGAAPSTNRYCGTCGAEIEPGMQFCGQCGASVTGVAGFEGATFAGAPRRGTFPPGARSAFASDTSPGYDDWSPADQDAPTEQFTPPFAYPNAPHRQSGAFGPHAPAPDAGGGLSREMSAFLGILCILGALVSGAGAIILAFIH